MSGTWMRYVALGDSFTEGLNDAAPAANGTPDASAEPVYRGWADRLAELLAADNPGFGYANLAIRGKLLGQIIDEQVPAALDLAPDLVSLVGGGNDILRPGRDLDAIAAALDEAVARLRASGAQVLLATGWDTASGGIMRLARRRTALLNAHIWSIAARHGAQVMDLWGAPFLKSWAAWSTDRLHMTSASHQQVAQLAAQVLGLGISEPAAPDGAVATVDSPATATPSPHLADHLFWARSHLLPWVGRRLRGQSSGDGREPKRPQLRALP